MIVSQMWSRVFLLLIGLALLPAVSGAQSSMPEWDVTQPKGTVRHIEFTTQEGTIQSLDISPDGKWLVFDLLAHIYRLPINGGEAVVLTQDSGIAVNYDPAYSPDGTGLAFISDRAGTPSLWIMNPDGTAPRLLLDGGEKSWIGQPAWAPDGTAVFVTRYYVRAHTPQTWVVPTQIWRVPINGRPAERVIGHAMSFVNRPSVSPDGRYLYYERMDAPDNIDGYFQVGDRHHVRRLNLETGADEGVTEAMGQRAYWDTPFHATAPEISPSGQELAFVRRVPFEQISVGDKTYNRSTGLWLRRLDEGTERLLLSPINPDLTDTKNGYHLRFANGYSWSADGRYIFLPKGGQIHRIDVETGQTKIIPFTAHVERTISEKSSPQFRLSATTYTPSYLQRPVSSADGRTTLFAAGGRIWKAAFPDGAPVPLVDTGRAIQDAPAWSADGKWIAFTTWDDAEGGHVWKVRPNGRGLKKLTAERGEYLNPAWSQDGASIYLVAGTGAMFRGHVMRDNPHFRLLKLPAEGGNAELLRHLPLIVRPDVRADGQLTYVEPIAPYAWPGAASGVSEYQPRMALVAIDEDGSNRREIATFPFSQDAALSPDGTQVAFQEGGNVLLGTLPADDGNAPYFNRSEFQENLKWVSQAGGIDPNWYAPGQLEFMNGNSYFRYDIRTGVLKQRELAPEFRKRATSERLVLQNARILTMSDRKVIESGTIVVSEGRIECVGACEIRRADHILDAAGMTVIPGLIDAHAHVPWDSGIFRQRNPALSVYLAYGVTTLFDPAVRAEQVFPSADLCGAELLICPRVVTTGPPLMPDLDMKQIRSVQDAIDEAKRLAAWGVVSLKQYAQPRRDVRQWIVEAARREGLGVTGERMNLYFDLAMIMDGQSGWEHILAEYPISSDVVKFVVQSGANYTPALQATGQGLYPSEYWRSRMDMDHSEKLKQFTPWYVIGRFRNAAQRPMKEYPVLFWMDTVREIVRAGGSVSAGAHSREDGIGLHWEIWTLATELTPVEALEAATLNPSRYLGFGEDLGTIETGKLADLVVLNANPLDDIQNTADIAYVIKNGILYDGDTLDEIWPEPQAYGPRPWMLPEKVGATSH